jgi:flagellar protein FlgJ
VRAVDANAALALDTQGLGKLKAQAASDPQRALKGVAQQFEAIFIDMMLKGMRETLPKDGLFDSQQTKLYTSMFDTQVSQSMASRGIGLADMMVKQLQRYASGSATPVEAKAAAGAGSASAATPTRPATAPPTSVLDSLPAKAGKALSSAIDGFTEKLLPHALEASQALGVPAFYMLGQAALETGWGKREIRGTDGEQSFNVFGIKAGKGWSGKVVEATTTEFVDGVAKKVVEKFRAYGSYAEAFADYAKLLASNPRYASAIGQVADASGFAKSLKQAGYATDPDYAGKLARTIDSLVNRYSKLG